MTEEPDVMTGPPVLGAEILDRALSACTGSSGKLPTVASEGNMMPDGFEQDPAWFFTGKQRDQAIAALRGYFERYTGNWFDQLVHSDQPDQITARDIVAVRR